MLAFSRNQIRFSLFIKSFPYSKSNLVVACHFIMETTDLKTKMGTTNILKTEAKELPAIKVKTLTIRTEATITTRGRDNNKTRYLFRMFLNLSLLLLSK